MHALARASERGRERASELRVQFGYQAGCERAMEVVQLLEPSFVWTGSEHQWGNGSRLEPEAFRASPVHGLVARVLVSLVAWVALNLVFYGLRWGRRRQQEAPRLGLWEFAWQRWVLRRPPEVVLHKLAEKHGPVMAVRAWSQSLLVLSSVAAVEEFFKLHDMEFGARPDSMGRVSIVNSFNCLCFPPLEAYWKHLQLVLDMTASERPADSPRGIEWALEALRPHGEVVDDLCDELERAWDFREGAAPELQERDIAQLPYLQAVVKELFRLHPPCAVSFPHESECGHRVFGFEVPPRTQVLVNIYSLQRDPVMWGDNAEAFDPVRFLAHPELDMQGQHFQLLPFGGGRRRCPGTKLAVQRVQLGLARHFSQRVKNGWCSKGLDR